jgi:uracil-DNA glycosylase family 4
MNNSRTTILAGLRSLMRYHQQIGLEHYPGNSSLRRFLAMESESAGLITSAEGPQSAALKPAGQHHARNTQQIESAAVSLEDIAGEVALCRACGLHKVRLYPVPGKGGVQVRLLIVGDFLAADVDEDLPQDHLFGVRQDQMLERMIRAISLSPAEVFVTNVIKCAIPAQTQPQASHVESCSSYLRRQIAAARPEIICTMGMVAARALLNKSLSLSRLRGRFHDYRLDQDITVPVLVTYHPSYLLYNEEMKRATWEDLQLLARRLGRAVVR